MANAIDDLRYISRYGYKDPWAEATNNITNSLLQYAKSKNDRDVLIAQVEQRREQENQRRIESQRDANIRILGSVPLVDRGDVAKNLGMTGSSVDAIVKVSDEAKIKSNAKDAYLKIIADPNASLDDKMDAATSGFSEADNTPDQSLFNNHKKNISTEQSKIFTANSYKKLGEMNRVILGDNYQPYRDAIDNGNIPLAKTIMENQARLTGNSYTVLSSMYKNVQDILSDEQTKKDNATGDPERLKAAENAVTSFQQRFLPVVPSQYRDPNGNFDTSMANWALNIKADNVKPSDTGTGTGTGTGTPEPKTQTMYVPIDGVSEGNISLPRNARVSLINPQTNKPFGQKFASDVAKRMIESGQGVVEQKSAMIEFEWSNIDGFGPDRRGVTYESIEKPGRYSMAGMQGRNKRMELRSGDDVMEKSSGKRFQVVIDVPPNNNIRDRINYIVNGKSYNFQQFMNKFAKPMYDMEEVEAMTQSIQGYGDKDSFVLIETKPSPSIPDSSLNAQPDSLNIQ